MDRQVPSPLDFVLENDRRGDDGYYSVHVDSVCQGSITSTLASSFSPYFYGYF